MTPFPDPTPLGAGGSLEADVFIGAIGFEDCAFAVVERLAEGGAVGAAVGIYYLPRNARNREATFEALVERAGVEPSRRYELVYDRYNPDRFSLATIGDELEAATRVVIDISGMSKFLIVSLFYELRDFEGELVVAHTEADVYHPTRERFEEERNAAAPPQEVPVYLTENVQDVVTTRALTSVAMQGQPTVLVTFLTFNHRELTALAAEVFPQHLVLVAGIPTRVEGHWRTEALRWTNKNVLEHVAPPGDRTLRELSMSDYEETVQFLEGIYLAYNATHRIVVAPTGSKRQALGAVLFKLMRPDVQFVYPVTRTFREEYTEGVSAVHEVRFVDWPGTVRSLEAHRHRRLRDIMIEGN